MPIDDNLLLIYPHRTHRIYELADEFYQCSNTASKTPGFIALSKANKI
jgi:hypothetical protein